jgi:hypothetical protein
MSKTIVMVNKQYLALLVLFFSFFLAGCSSTDRKVFVYGFGTMEVPKTSTIEDINAMVRERYGANLFWSPR